MSKSILLIPKGFLGDVLLTTPVVAALKQAIQGVQVSVVCTPATAEFVQRDPLVRQVLVYDRRGAHRGWQGLRALSAQIKAQGFDVAYSFHRSPRTALLVWMAGIGKRVGFSDAFLGLAYTHRVNKDPAVHDVMRNLSLVSDDLDEATRSDMRAQLASTDGGPSWLDLRVPEVVEERLAPKIRDMVQSLGQYIVLSPGSAWETKRWDASRFREVAHAFSSRGVRVVVVGAAGDAAVCAGVCTGIEAANVCGETSLEDLVALVRGAATVVCNDSLAMHVASATKTPVVAIFCATSPRFGFGPWRNKNVVVEKADLFCKPCHRHGGRRCPTGTGSCMTGVSSAEVICAVESFLREQGSARPIRYLEVIES